MKLSSLAVPPHQRDYDMRVVATGLTKSEAIEGITMNNFKKQFKQGDDYCDIRADYRSLISIGKSVEETEDLLLRAYCPKEGDLLFTPTFWLSLGICEWETGRLTPRTKEEALYCLSLYQETVEQRLNAGPNERLSDMLQFFRETQEMLLSPLPEAKKISKPYARKCP